MFMSSQWLKSTVTFLLVYTGLYWATNELPTRITDGDNYPQVVKIGLISAVCLKNYEKLPIIGEVVVVVNKANFAIQYCEECYNKPWIPHMVFNKCLKKARCPYTGNLPLGCIVLAGFSLYKTRKVTEKMLKNKIWRFKIGFGWLIVFFITIFCHKLNIAFIFFV